MSDMPWWALPLVAAVFALAGAGAVLLVRARGEHPGGGRRRTRRWYEERKHAYVELLAVYERVLFDLRSGARPDPAAYLGRVGPALAQVRLLASGPVRSAALAVHLLLEKLQTPGPASAPPGVEPEKHFRELLAQVPLVVQQFEEAIRDELEISTTRPVVAAQARRRTG